MNYLYYQDRRRGITMIYMVSAMTVLMGAMALAVDWGRLQLAKTELQATADACSRAAAGSLTTGVTAAEDQAVWVGTQNKCDGQPVTIDKTQDIEFGYYDTTAKTFTVLTGSARSSANAVRVTARRDVARGNPIQLTFSRAFGKPTGDVRAVSTAVTLGEASYIGLSLTRMFNYTQVDSYSSAMGAYSGSNSGSTANLIGTTDLLLDGYATVRGEAHWGTSGTLTKDSTATVSPGPLTQLAFNYNFVSPTAGTAATVNNNSYLGSYCSSNKVTVGSNRGTIVVNGGTFYLTDMTIGDNSTLYFNSPTTIYLAGDGTIQGTIAAQSLRPGDLQIKVIGSNKVEIKGDGIVYGYIYAPDSDVHHHDNGQSFGGVISSLLCFRHYAQGHQDMSGGASGTPGGIGIVK